MILVAAAVYFSPGLVAAGLSQPTPRIVKASPSSVPELEEVYGSSVQGRPLRAYVLGTGSNKTMVFGGFHGNERSVPGVLNTLHQYLDQHPEQWPNCTIILVPCANPDGWAADTRVNARQIDINRNFPARTWKAAKRAVRNNPGLYADSEPETQAVIRLVKKYGPTKIISIHQPLHLLNWTGIPGKRLARVMQKANGYRLTDNVGYPTPGSFGDYCGERSIAVVTLELPNQSAAGAWAKNREVLLAAFKAST